MMTFASHILSFYETLPLPTALPPDVTCMNPYQSKETWELTEKFYQNFYNDTHTRTMIIGINPGRFGAGATGVPFTDPIRLQEICGILNNLQKKPELSSEFIYKMIHHYGGVASFYTQFFFSAVSPLGFTKDGKNLNYYDHKILQSQIEPFAVDWMNQQLTRLVNRQKAFCLGEGKNYDFLQRLNERHHFFDSIVALPHPRFVMQYKRKSLPKYLDLYITALTEV
jgi:hypothetical protein